MFDLNKDKIATVCNVTQVWFEVFLAVSAKVKLLIFGRIVGAIFNFFWAELLCIREP